MTNNAKHTARTVFLDPDFRRVAHRKSGQQVCHICGRLILEGRPFRVVQISPNSLDMEAVHPADIALVRLTEDFMPIGMNCAKKIGMEWTHGPEMLVIENQRKAHERAKATAEG
jgi:hypothetical protein